MSSKERWLVGDKMAIVTSGVNLQSFHGRTWHFTCWEVNISKKISNNNNKQQWPYLSTPYNPNSSIITVKDSGNDFLDVEIGIERVKASFGCQWGSPGTWWLLFLAGLIVGNPGHPVDTLTSVLWVTERYNDMTSDWLKTIYMLADFSKQSLRGLKLLLADTSRWNRRERKDVMISMIRVVRREIWYVLSPLSLCWALLNAWCKVFK